MHTIPGIKKYMGKRFRRSKQPNVCTRVCPCCDYVTLPDEADNEICPVCHWGFDGLGADQFETPSAFNDDLTLGQARKNFQKFGAADESWVKKVCSNDDRATYLYRPGEMTISTALPQLSFHFLAPGNHFFIKDYQVLVLIDDEDVIAYDDCLYGLAPQDFFAQNALRDSGQLLVGLLPFYDQGTHAEVLVQRFTDRVEWLFKRPAKRTIAFELPGYDKAIEKAACCNYWEPGARTAERQIAELDFSEFSNKGLTFEWASTRKKQHTIRMYFANQDGEREIFELPWESGAAVKVVQEALKMRNLIKHKVDPSLVRLRERAECPPTSVWV